MLKVQDLSVTVGGTGLLRDIAFECHPGLTAVIGPNGAGKSTLLRAIAGLIPNTSGKVYWQQQNLLALSARERAGQLAWQAQEPHIHWPVRVEALVRLARSHCTESPANTRDAVAGALEKTGMQDFSARNVRTLSGGERARALLAHTLAAGTDLLLVDEPVAALDPAWALAQLQLLKSEADEGKTVLCVLHDMQWVHAFADHVLVLQAGELVAKGNPRELIANGVLQNVFGVAFAPDGAMVLPT